MKKELGKIILLILTITIVSCLLTTKIYATSDNVETAQTYKNIDTIEDGNPKNPEEGENEPTEPSNNEESEPPDTPNNEEDKPIDTPNNEEDKPIDTPIDTPNDGEDKPSDEPEGEHPNDTGEETSKLTRVTVDGQTYKDGATITVENEKSSVEVYGNVKLHYINVNGNSSSNNVKLKEGTNTITVTDNNGGKITIKISRKEKGADEQPNVIDEPQEPEEKEKLQLSSLEIENLELTPKFSPDTYSYTVNINVGEKDYSSIKVKAIANQEDATIKIEGAEELVEGKNIVDIVIKSQDGTETKTYQIIVNKIKEKNEQALPTSKNENNENKSKKIIACIIGGLIIIVAVAIIIMKYKKNAENNSSYDDDDDDLYKNYGNYNPAGEDFRTDFPKNGNNRDDFYEEDDEKFFERNRLNLKNGKH